MEEPRFQCLDCDKIFHVEIVGSNDAPEVIGCPLCNSTRVEKLPESVAFLLEEGEHAGWAGSIS